MAPLSPSSAATARESRTALSCSEIGGVPAAWVMPQTTAANCSAHPGSLAVSRTGRVRCPLMRRLATGSSSWCGTARAMSGKAVKRAGTLTLDLGHTRH
jgi:hypothetical protein